MVNNIFSDKKGGIIIISVLINGLKWDLYEDWSEVNTILVVRLECKIYKVFILSSVKDPLRSQKNSPISYWRQKW